MNEMQSNWSDGPYNVFSGCQKVSPGCKFCYAETDAENKRGTKAFPHGFDLTIRKHKLNDPSKVREPKRLFVASMSDFFWEQISDALRDEIVDVMETANWHDYLVLTKRPEEMLRYSKRRKLPSNFWAGVSIENQKYAGRADILRQVDAEIRFVSMEPLLGPIDLNYSGIHWVVVVGESGRHLSDPANADRTLVAKVDGKWQPRPECLDWVRQIRDGAKVAGVPLFFMQWGGPRRNDAGDELDGRQWKQYPRERRVVIASNGQAPAEAKRAKQPLPIQAASKRPKKA